MELDERVRQLEQRVAELENMTACMRPLGPNPAMERELAEHNDKALADAIRGLLNCEPDEQPTETSRSLSSDTAQQKPVHEDWLGRSTVQ